jgi:DNA mismatch endonuclease (patch repair protein)
MARRQKPGQSYRGLRSSSDHASLVGRSNRAENTTPERILRRALSRYGVRFRLHCRQLPGCPDVVLFCFRTVIFCDGDFWHGRNWKIRKLRLQTGSNASYWVAKIGQNRKRDREVNGALSRLGWHVIRVWEMDLRRNPERVLDRIVSTLEATSRNRPR